MWSRAEGCDLAVLSFNVQDMHEIREMFRCSVQVFCLYKMMEWRWESFGRRLEVLGKWVGSNVLGSSWGVGWEAIRKTTSKSCRWGLLSRFE